MSRKQPLTRNQLAEFLPNHEAIKAFERIMDEVYNLLPTDIVALINLANEAYLQGSTAGNHAEETSGNSRQFDYLDFPISSVPVAKARRVFYDDGDGTLELVLKGGNVSSKLGQGEIQLCFNGSASSLPRGTVVQVTGEQGNRIKVDRAKADAEASSNHTFGFVAEPITNGAEGYVINSGLIRKLNTITDSDGNALTARDTLYLSPLTSGGYTKVKPVSPNHSVIVGFVVRVHASVGEIFVKIDNGYELDELHNVYLPSPVADNSLTYNATNLRWEAGPVIKSGTYTPTLTNVTNVAASTAAVCQWMRVGSVVTVSGTVDIDPTAAGACVLRMSLPVASNFSAVNNAGGTFSTTTAGQSDNGSIIANVASDVFEFGFNAVNIANAKYAFSATYQVI
jgi:hypothetical protein